MGSRGGVQHPSYRFDLRGAGDVVLTDLRRGDSGLVFPAEVQGEFREWIQRTARFRVK